MGAVIAALAPTVVMWSVTVKLHQQVVIGMRFSPTGPPWSARPVLLSTVDKLRALLTLALVSPTAPPWSAPRLADTVDRSTVECSAPWTSARSLASLDQV